MEINKTCCFTGHRPKKCKGSEKAISKALRKEILKAIEEFGTSIALVRLIKRMNTVENYSIN